MPKQVKKCQFGSKNNKKCPKKGAKRIFYEVFRAQA
jgi:hypothetical protein